MLDSRYNEEISVGAGPTCRVFNMTNMTSPRESHDVTDVRYGTRSLLIGMAAVAATLTALGAFIRLFPADVRPRLVVHWGILFAMLAACVAYNARRRYVAEKKAGTVRFLLTPHNYYFPRMPRFARVVVGTFLLLCGPALWVAESFLIAENANNLWMQLLNWQTYLGAAASGAGMTYLWWHRKVRVCDQGLVVRHSFAPWKDCRRWYRDACYRDVIVLEFQKHGRTAVKVPDTDRTSMEALLKARFVFERAGGATPQSL
jgi:hypothetical protein